MELDRRQSNTFILFRSLGFNFLDNMLLTVDWTYSLDLSFYIL